jgi:hypothetical protein
MNTVLEPGRAVKDCVLDKGYLIERLGYQFTLLTAKNSLSTEEKRHLAQNNIALIEIDSDENANISNLYDLASGSAYLFTPDQYVLGRWRNVQVKNVLELTQNYLAGDVFEEESLIKTEQEMIDEAVANALRNCQISNSLQPINQ